MALKLLGHIELPESLNPGGSRERLRRYRLNAGCFLVYKRGQAAGRSSFYHTQNE